MTNSKNDKLRIVLFFHDGPEHINGEKKNIKNINGNEFLPWHVGTHRRKFVLNKGKFIDSNNILQEDAISFWTEWEAPSKFEKINYNNVVNDEYPNYIHTSLYIQNLDTVRANSDPYVFGENFKYCCCKQNRDNSKFLRHLAKNSIILYGSKLCGKFILDTVFVVDSKLDYSVKDVNKLYDKSWVTKSYYLTSLKPLRDEELKS